ncbi:MAG TPA: HAMP domain-containing sensor histidine kinase, partial [Chloroflexota bacterium]|nr:HAMP domain-containing sensor histidine kinase [Chloroflexota bacterium]
MAAGPGGGPAAALGSVRFRLTLLYLGAGTVLVALICLVAYLAAAAIFLRNVDAALEQRVAAALSGNEAAVADTPASGSGRSSRREDDDEREERAARRAADADLAPVFLLPLDRTGALVGTLLPPPAPLPPDRASAAAALRQGTDRRTVRAPDGARVRFFTYRVPGAPPHVALLQAGRYLTDLDRLLAGLLGALGSVGAVATAGLGTASWVLAGRTIAPARRAWERQREFIAGASHELRAPLAVLRASAEVALRESDVRATEQRALLQDVLGETDHLARLVDDLLLLSRLDSGRVSIERAPVNLTRLAAEVGRQILPLAERAGVRVHAPVAAGTAETEHVTALGDAGRIRQVLLALLDNALRHTPPGGDVRIETHSGRGKATLTVADSGDGIPPEAIGRVFEPFFRARKTDRGADTG